MGEEETLAGLPLLGRESDLQPAAGRHVRWGELRRPEILVYGVVSGILAATIGAVASLSVEGTARIALWGTVTGAASVASGLAHESAMVTACLSGVRRWMRWGGVGSR